MKMRFLILAAAFAANVSVFAQDKPGEPMGPPGPAKEMDQLKYFTGNWTCDGQIAEAPGAPLHPSKANVSALLDMDGMWVTGTVKGVKAPGTPFAIWGTFHETYDPAKKEFVLVWVDNTGGRSNETSPGWSGDTMTFTGDAYMGGQTFGTRDIFTKKSDHEMVHKMEANTGEWKSLGEEICKKSAPAKK